MNSNTEVLKEEFLKLKEIVEPLIQNGDTEGRSHLQNYLFFACYPLFSFVESVIILSEKGKFRVVESLLRSLFELHINVIYYQVAESDRRLAISVKEEFHEQIKGIREIKQLIQKYPNLKSTNPQDLFSDEWLRDAEKRAEIGKQAVIRGNNLGDSDRELCLKDKAIKCDQANLKNVENGHFERMYHVIYRQLSPATHLNIGGIQNFVDQDANGRYSFSHGDDREHFLVHEAIQICIALTKDLYENKVIESDMPDIVYKIESLLKE